MSCENVSDTKNHLVLQAESGEKVTLTFSENCNEEVERVILDALMISYEERIAKAAII